MRDEPYLGPVATVIIGGGFSLAVLGIWGMNSTGWLLLGVGVGVVVLGWLLAVVFGALMDWLDRRDEHPRIADAKPDRNGDQ